MSEICEHEFDRPDVKNPKYSSLEYDLYAKLQMSIRKNFNTNKFEIYSLKTGGVLYVGSFDTIVNKANELEHSKATINRCTSRCPLVQQEKTRRHTSLQ